MKMNPEVKAAWVAALRSGKYQQGKNSLRTADDKFCCLGVLCDIVNPNGWNVAPSGVWSANPPGEVLEKNFPPPFIREATGWPSTVCDPVVTLPFFEVDGVGVGQRDLSLSSLNDSGNWSFEQIAALIEEQL